MNTSGEAADQVIRMSLNGVEVAARISGKVYLKKKQKGVNDNETVSVHDQR